MASNTVYVNNLAQDLRPVAGSIKSLTVSTSAVSFAADWDAADGDYVLLSISGDAARITFDGTAPVAAATGHLYAEGDNTMLVSVHAANALKAIRNGSTDCILTGTQFAKP